MPPIIVEHDANWVPVDLHGNLRRWSGRTARDIVSRVPSLRGRRSGKHIASLLEEAGAIARKPPEAALAFLLIPDVRDRIKAIVRFRPVDLADRGEDEARAELVSALSTDEFPDVTELPTPAGPCRRIRARYAAGDGPQRSVGEHLNYVWMLPRWGAAVVMSTAFEDLLEASRWQPALDELAIGVRLAPGSRPAGEELSA